jgi:3-mercaptopyruvate sulfurtransferase SseA
MILKQFYLNCLAHASYLVGDEDTPGGYRSSIAGSLLQRRGFTKIGELAGGLAAWEAARLPVTTLHSGAPTGKGVHPPGRDSM